MAVVHLDDPDDDSLSAYRNVPDPELMARGGLFVAEGRLVVSRLLEACRLAVRSVLVTEPAYRSIARPLEARPEVLVYVVPQQVMNAIVGFNIHRGCLALGERPPLSDWRELARRSQRLVVLEGVGNADNVGAIFRNGAAFGVDGILLGPATADPLYRKAIRTSMGAALSIPFASIDPWPASLGELKEAAATIALTPAADAAPLRDVAVGAGGGRPVALVLGHEGDGLTEDALRWCEFRARIPMAHGIDSLNVAAASAIALYELAGR